MGAILMFSDGMFKDLDPQEERWDTWCQAVAAKAKAKAEVKSPLRIAILEVGAGGNVTTVRSRSETSLECWSDAGADVKFIRVNPDFPLGDGSSYQPHGADSSKVVSVMARGLESIRKIDTALAALG